MQCKDIPDRPILDFIERNTRDFPWCNTIFRDSRDVRQAFPHGFDTPMKLVQAKLNQMKRRGVLNGCACGCRGDWEIAPKGTAELAREEVGNADDV